MKHKITDFQIIRHGVEQSDYFQGCGTSFTNFNHCVTGIGDTEAEAFDECLELIASGFESIADGELERFEREHGETWDSRDVKTVCGLSDQEVEEADSLPDWHVSVRYNVQALEPAIA